MLHVLQFLLIYLYVKSSQLFVYILMVWCGRTIEQLWILLHPALFGFVLSYSYKGWQIVYRKKIIHIHTRALWPMLLYGVCVLATCQCLADADYFFFQLRGIPLFTNDLWLLIQMVHWCNVCLLSCGALFLVSYTCIFICRFFHPYSQQKYSLYLNFISHNKINICSSFLQYFLWNMMSCNK